MNSDNSKKPSPGENVLHDNKKWVVTRVLDKMVGLDSLENEKPTYVDIDRFRSVKFSEDSIEIKKLLHIFIQEWNIKNT